MHRQILAVPPLLRKPKEEDGETRQFRSQVEGGQKALRTLVQGRIRKAKDVDAQRRNDITAAVLSALQTPNRPVDGPVATFPKTLIAENVEFAAAAVVLRASDALVREYERVNKAIVEMAGETGGRDAVADGWRKEVKDLERVLRAGASKAENDVARVLGGVRVEEKGRDEDGDGNVDVDMDDRQSTQAGVVSEELKNSLTCMERGVRRMVKALPSEGEEE